MEDFQGFGGCHEIEISTSDWLAQELLDVPEALLFTSDIPNTSTHYLHHDVDGESPIEHLMLGPQAFGHDTGVHITDRLGLPAGHMTWETQNFGPGTAMHNTENQDLFFPTNEDVAGWHSNPTAVVPDSVGLSENSSQTLAREHSSYTNGDVNNSSLGLPAYSEQKGSPLRTCGIATCNFRYTSPAEYQVHLRASHTGDYVCHQCTMKATNLENLGWHAQYTGHLSFTCKHENCDKKFSRLDSYQRHERNHRADAKRFPCKYCRKYRGTNGFKRKDHLTQHVRNYHHIDEDNVQRGLSLVYIWCPRKGCSHNQGFVENIGKQPAFSTVAEYYKHMRTFHDESDFPCPQPGCDRINGKGYFRKADLRTHLRKVHGTDGSLEGDRI